jgi:hypothetical protein
MPKNREIKSTVSAINNALSKQNVYGHAEEGGIHLVRGNV